MWRRHETYNETISIAWIPGCSSLLAVQDNLNSMQVVLKTWDCMENYGNFGNNLRWCDRTLLD
jgi:hypothetical protein